MAPSRLPCRLRAPLEAAAPRAALHQCLSEGAAAAFTTSGIGNGPVHGTCPQRGASPPPCRRLCREPARALSPRSSSSTSAAHRLQRDGSAAIPTGPHAPFTSRQPLPPETQRGRERSTRSRCAPRTEPILLPPNASLQPEGPLPVTAAAAAPSGTGGRGPQPRSERPQRPRPSPPSPGARCPVRARPHSPPGAPLPAAARWRQQLPITLGPAPV
ncbi:skin secretory protein xP2-like [Melopsittacus undulatus]|uniref:skin secretory protein xP2-like n=1 Tax=Melopsittacus undulatus TaxID=13146 RepID=UPI00146B79FB|nr:skin secretory protein xP2-like [Melopsittacus undulatus]